MDVLLDARAFARLDYRGLMETLSSSRSVPERIRDIAEEATRAIARRDSSSP